MTAVDHARSIRLGLTGGIGSGKSTVGNMLATMGAVLIDADQISKDATGPHGAAIDAIRAEFGNGYVDASGALDRSRMRELVFNEPEARAQLEAIIHPIVSLQSHLKATEAMKAGARMIVHDIPLLAESGQWTRQLDAVLVVDCPVETQLERVVRRSGLAPEMVCGIIASQATRQARRSIADVVITNNADCTLEALEGQVGQVARLFGL